MSPEVDQQQFAERLIERLSPLSKSLGKQEGGSSHTQEGPTNKWRRLDQGAAAKPLTEAQAARKANKKKMAHSNYQKKRAVKQKDLGHISHRTIRPAIEKKYIAPAQDLKVDVSTNDIKKNVASGSYIGTNDNGERNKAHLRLKMLVGEDSRYKFTYIVWNGK